MAYSTPPTITASYVPPYTDWNTYIRANFLAYESHAHTGSSDGAGSLTVADGTNTAPSYSNNGDTNTGMYFPAADSIGFTTGGTLRLTFDTNTSGDAWTSYTPTWTNLTIGNATQSAKYWRVGKLVVVKIDMTWGTTTSASSTILVSMPFTATAPGSGTSAVTPVGIVNLWDASGSVGWTFPVTFDSTGNVRIRHQNGTTGVGANVTNTSPVTWATSDEFHYIFAYEAA